MMRFLLDTHIWLWAATEPHKLTSTVHTMLNSPESERFLSPISLWELSVLVGKKRFTLKDDFVVWVQRSISDLNLKESPLSWKIAFEMSYILPNHKDPADRFLAATAVAYDLTLVTNDQKLIGIPGLKVLANV
jgi:PIN domain nuclease of toxin-antitoxin system